MIGSRNKQLVASGLKDLSLRLGFRSIDGFAERVVGGRYPAERCFDTSARTMRQEQASFQLNDRGSIASFTPETDATVFLRSLPRHGCAGNRELTSRSPVLRYACNERPNRTLRRAVLRRTMRRFAPNCAVAQRMSAAHNVQAVNTQHLDFRSRRCDIYHEQGTEEFPGYRDCPERGARRGRQ